FVQRKFGALRSANPVHLLKAGVAVVDFIQTYRRELTGSEVFLEVGTGRCLSLPIAVWCCGAFQTITVDLNPYLKSELIFEEIDYIKTHQESLRQIFGAHAQKPIFRQRFELLLSCKRDLRELLSLINVRYLAPADAGHLDLASRSIDYHVSYGVVEHVARSALDGIFSEAIRLLKSDGLALHYAALADLFSGEDDSISRVNFLQFSEEEWDSIAGNRYMYHNRLRIDELIEVFTRAGFRILTVNAKVHPDSLRVLQSGALSLDVRFATKSPETNASEHAWVVAELPGSRCETGPERGRLNG